MIRLFMRFSRKEWGMIFVAVCFITFGVWLDLMIPELTGKITAAISPSRDNPSLPGGTMKDIWVNGGLMMLCCFGSAATVVLVGYISAVISASFSAKLREDIFKKVGTFSTQEMKKFSVASLITRSTNDVTQIRMFVAVGLQLLIKAPITAVWAILKITGRSWQLSLVTSLAVIVMVVMICFVLFLVIPRFRKIQTLTDKLNQVARENLTGIRVVRAYNAEAHEAAKFGRASGNLNRNSLFTYRVMGVFMPFMSLVMSGMFLAIWWLSAVMIDDGTLELSFAPHIMEFNQYSFQIVFSFMMMVMIFIMMPRATVSARRIIEILQTAPTICDGQATGRGDGEGGLVFRNVSFKYPDAADYVLRDISLSVKRGQTVAFIGSTGSGKSTLVNLVPRLYDATEGAIFLNGLDIRDFTQEKLRDRVGYIPQVAVIFSGTVASNVAFGTVHGGKQISEEEVLRALDVAQASEFVNNLEKGIHSEISQSGRNLSGGQKQRIAIARVVARRPDVFIFDDTFSALDYKTDKALRDSLRKNCEGAIVLIVAQRIGTIKDADQIVVLDEGVIVGMGTHEQLLDSCEVYKEIAYSQLSKEELGINGK